jgi:hypothetical protein
MHLVFLRAEGRMTRKAGLQWLMPGILATQEPEIRRIAVRSQPGQIVERPYLEKPYHKKLGWWSGSR